MAVMDRNALGELVDCADVAIRVASQLRLFEKGVPIRDTEALERAVDFLSAAEAGGVFMSSGNVSGLGASLRPLNWAVDARYGHGRSMPEVSPSEAGNVDYGHVAKYLRAIRDTINKIKSKERPNGKEVQTSIQFFRSLGNVLATRADASMRRPSVPF